MNGTWKNKTCILNFSCGTPKEETMQRDLGVAKEIILTLCHWAMCKDLFALRCILDFSIVIYDALYALYTHQSASLPHLLLKIIHSLKQHVWISNYKYTDPS